MQVNHSDRKPLHTRHLLSPVVCPQWVDSRPSLYKPLIIMLKVRSRPTPALYGRAMNDRFILQSVIARQRLNPAKPRENFMDTAGIDAIKKQQVEKNIQIQRAAKALDQGDGAGVGRLVCPPCLFDQMRGEEGTGRVW